MVISIKIYQLFDVKSDKIIWQSRDYDTVARKAMAIYGRNQMAYEIYEIVQDDKGIADRILRNAGNPDRRSPYAPHIYRR